VLRPNDACDDFFCVCEVIALKGNWKRVPGYS